MSSSTRFSTLVMIAMLASAPAWGQVTQISAFPTGDVTDSRMLSFGCVGTDTFEQDVSISIGVPGDATSFDILIFDGDSGGTDSGGLAHWDLIAGSPAGRELIFELYFDPEKQASTADLVATWFGNSSNPLVSPSADPNKQWTTADELMLDNDWWTVSVDTAPSPLDDPAKAPSGNRFYHLLIKKDSACVSGEELVSNLKFATSTPETFILSQFGFEAAFRAGANDRNIIYPDNPFPGPIPPLDATTTYDGTFEFFINVPQSAVELTLFDGDFDQGIDVSQGAASFPGAQGIPSGADLTDPTVIGGECADTDDANTPDPYDFPPELVLGGAVAEGANAPGDPPDDNKLDIFRRGWLANQSPATSTPTNAGCVRYSVFDPTGVEYRNANPSGNLEWERFRIATINAASPNTADYGPAIAADGVTFVTTSTLPAGIWRVFIEGLDLANLNFWFLAGGACGLVDGVAICPPTIYLLGDTVFLDFDGDGVQEAGEPGVPGVIVNLFLDPGQPPIATRVTGDTSAPDFDDCVSNNTGLDEVGLYCFGVDDPDTYTVGIAPENFDPGGALFDLFSTTGGEEQADTLAGCGQACGPDDNVLTYDFGYTGVSSIGDRVWLDLNADGVQDGGEAGINDVTVELRDAGADILLATDVTAGDGDYLFDNLPPGSYKVVVVTSTLPPGFDQTFDLDGTLDDTTTVPLGFNEDRDDVDFGYVDECLPNFDFETDGQGAALTTGQIIDDEWANLGVTVTTNDPVNHPAMIFDSANPTGGDDDLGTPNQTFSGPGIGAGGEAGQPGENAVALDKVLIISEDGNTSNPDDNGAGGTIIFTFASPVRVDQIGILDIDEGMGGTITARDSGGAVIGAVAMTGNLGNNSVQTVTLGAAGVSRLEVFFPGSGAVSGIVWCVEDSVCLPDLDFDHDDAGDPLSAGTIVSDQFAGITVTTDDPVNHPAMIFDSANPTGGDDDLGTPNQAFGGPGVGSGGASGPGANTVAQGNVLIISEDGDTSDPDDNAGDGTITFTFAVPVFTASVDILDIDSTESMGTVRAFDAATGGNELAVGQMQLLGSNSLQRVQVPASGVRRLEVWFPSSGAVAKVTFCEADCVPKRVRDDFESSSFGNNDGPDSWSGPWIENDPESGGAGPSAGQVRVSGGGLQFDDYPNTGGEPSAARQADLSGAVSATLRFDFDTSSGVDSDDAVTVEVSSDGGGSWTTLEVITGIAGATWQARTFDISGFISSQTQVRFRVSNKYGGSGETFFVGFVEIETGCGGCVPVTVRDDFSTESFSNNDGPDNWAGSWIENDPEAGGAGPSAGQVRVLGGFLKLDDQPNTGGYPSAARQVNLSGASSATFSFDFLTTNGVDTSDAVTVEVSSDGGGSWSTLEVITGIYGASAGSRSFDITAWASSQTQVRFRVSNLYGGSDEFFKVDFVEIVSECDEGEPEPEPCPCVGFGAGWIDPNFVSGNWDAFVGGAFSASTTCVDDGSRIELVDPLADAGAGGLAAVEYDPLMPPLQCEVDLTASGSATWPGLSPGEALGCRDDLKAAYETAIGPCS